MTVPYDPEHITYFGETDYRNERTRFGIKARDRTRHMYVIGKSGVGKSTLLENMAIQDIQRGEGVAVLDPHGSFAEKMLDYVPAERIKDVVYFAPFDTENPISFNVLEDVGHDKRHLVASGLMSSFKKIWVDAWSARMEYILNNILLALLEYPDATLLGVNRMLSDKVYRNKVVENLTDPSVKSFWTDEFAKYGERYMQEAGAAIQNKIGQFTANPLVRNIIGQTRSSFDIRKVMDEQKILIINLSKGRIGEQNTSLLGSMIITKIYLSAMSRAEVTANRMGALPNFYFYVDEFQSFANETFADILAEARKYKLALIIAHQYVAQMEEKVRDAVFGNVGTTVSFRVGPLDAELLEKVFSPQFMANDLINLGMVQVYLSLMINDIGSPPFSARTLPPLIRPTITFRNDVIEHSRSAYAHPKDKVEEDIQAWYLLDAQPPEDKQKKIRFADGQAPRMDGAPFKRPFSPTGPPQRQERVYTPAPRPPTEAPVQSAPAPASSSVPAPAPSPAPRPSYQKLEPKKQEFTKPFEKAFAQPIEREPAPQKEPELSPTLKHLLGALDGTTANHEQPQTAAQEKPPEKKESPVAPREKGGSPFDGEKPLSDIVRPQPVKLQERGPSEKNRDLLRAVLEKAGAAPSAATPPAPAAPAPSAPPEHKPSEQKPDAAHATSQTGEVSPHELQKILE